MPSFFLANTLYEGKKFVPPHKQLKRSICRNNHFFSLARLRGAVSEKKVEEVDNVDRCGDLFAVV
jgi:hypothetical protein